MTFRTMVGDASAAAMLAAAAEAGVKKRFALLVQRSDLRILVPVELS